MRTDSRILMEFNQHGHRLSLLVHSLLLADPSQYMLCEDNFHKDLLLQKLFIDLKVILKQRL